MTDIPSDDVERRACELANAVINSYRREYTAAMKELMAAALQQAEQRGRESAGKWQPISTAPRDVPVLCAWADGTIGQITIGTDTLATHWMPLPEPPHDK